MKAAIADRNQLARLLDDGIPVLVVGKTSDGAESFRSQWAAQVLKQRYPTLIIVDRENQPRQAAQCFRRSLCDYTPQLFLGGEFIGGAQVIHEFLRSGEHLRTASDSQSNHGVQFDSEPRVRSKSVWRIVAGWKPDQWLSACADGSVHVYNCGSQAHLGTFPICAGWVNCAAVDPAGAKVYCGTTDCELRAFDPSPNSVSLVATTHTRWVNSIIFSRCGTYGFVGDGEGSVTQLVGHRRIPRKRSRISNASIWSLESDSSGQVVAVGDALGYTSLCKCESLGSIVRLKTDRCCVTDVVFSPYHEGFLTVGFGGAVALIVNNRIVRTCVLHRKRIWSVALVHDGKEFATASADGTVGLWSSVNFQNLAFWKFSSQPIGLRFSPSSESLIIGHENGEITFQPIGASVAYNSW